MTPSNTLVLQRLTFPDPDIAIEEGAFITRSGGAVLRGGALHLTAGYGASFETWVNLFHLGHWRRQCHLDGLWLTLAGQGRLTVEVVAMETDTSLFRAQVDLAGPETCLDLSALMLRRHAEDPAPERAAWMHKYQDTDPPGGYMLGLRIWAETDVVLRGGAYLTRDTHARDVQLALGITTFRREADVTQTAARMEAYFASDAGADVGARTHAYIIDNGQSLDLENTPHRTVLPNANLGGAGGFARALSVAQEADEYTHVLFMDDDASFPMESLARTISFLRLARSDKAAVSGAMISAAQPHAMWEYGAVFDRFCRPQFIGTDLRNKAAVIHMEFHAADPKPDGFYAGWWFFAFPIAHVAHYPYPFFVRGDDISFSLAHDFDTVTLNGVVSLQEDFGAKESPQTLYLDLRNHLHHHLIHEDMEIGPRASGGIALRFIVRSLVRMHYASAEAQCRSWEDLMRGPDFFAANADMADKRAEIGKIAAPEAWVDDPDRAQPAPCTHPGHRLSRWMVRTLNGHLIPFFKPFAREIEVNVTERALLWPLWGAGRVTFVDTGPEVTRSYTVAHDKRQFIKLAWRAAGLYLRWIRAYPALKKAHREGYATLATKDWWQERFDA